MYSKSKKIKLAFLIMFFNLVFPAAAQTYTHTFTCDTLCNITELNVSKNCTTICALEFVNVSGFYNATETDEALAQYVLNDTLNSTLDDYYNELEIDMKFAVVEHNLTALDDAIEDMVMGMLVDYQGNITTAELVFEDILDSKIDKLKETFVTAEEVNSSISENMAWIPSYVANKTNFFDRIGMYVLVGLGLVGAIMMAFYKYKPLRQFVAVRMKSEVRDISSLITDEDLKKRRSAMMGLKKLLIKDKKLKLNEKQAIARKIDRMEIYDEESLKDEMDIVSKLGG